MYVHVYIASYVFTMHAGRNSRTAMIATISPADINFDETLGTLRFVCFLLETLHRLLFVQICKQSKTDRL